MTPKQFPFPLNSGGTVQVSQPALPYEIYFSFGAVEGQEYIIS